MTIDAFNFVLPEFEVPITFIGELENMTIDDKFTGMLGYEVIAKSEGGVKMRLKHLNIKPNKRATV